MRKLIFAFLLLVILVSWTFTQSTESVRPSVSVVGEAQMSISPDQVTFTFEIITTDKDVSAAKRANDRNAAKTLDAAKAFGISPQDIQTDRLTISPKYTSDKDSRGEHVLIGYEVTKRLLVTLKDLTKIDSFLAKAIESGVNRVVEVSIENSQMQKYQEQVRALAIKNAQSKAQAYAQQLGQTVGKAYVIREENADLPSFSNGIGSGSGSGTGGNGDATLNESPALKNPFGTQTTFALGQIKIEEKIYVTFELH